MRDSEIDYIERMSRKINVNRKKSLKNVFFPIVLNTHTTHTGRLSYQSYARKDVKNPALRKSLNLFAKLFYLFYPT